MEIEKPTRKTSGETRNFFPGGKKPKGEQMQLPFQHFLEFINLKFFFVFFFFPREKTFFDTRKKCLQIKFIADIASPMHMTLIHPWPEHKLHDTTQKDP